MSLNKGEAVVQFTPRNSVGIADVRKVVSRNGFTPREARVIAEGALSKGRAELLLTLGGDRRYALTESPDAPDKWAALQKVALNQRLRVTGVVPAKTAKNIRIAVLDFVVLPNGK